MFKDPFLLIPDVLTVTANNTNVAGLRDYMMLVPIEQVREVMPQNSDGFLPSAVMILKNMRQCSVKVAHDSGLFIETMGTDVNGIFWTQELTFDLAKDNPALSGWISQNVEMGFLGFITNKNGQSYLLGDMDCPLLFQQDIGGSSTRAGYNKRAWKLIATVNRTAPALKYDYSKLIVSSEADGDLWLTFPYRPYSDAFSPAFNCQSSSNILITQN